MLTLRSYRGEDEAAVVALWWASWHSIGPGLRHPRPLSDWRARWRDEIVPRERIVVAEDDGAVVGFAAADVTARLLDQLFVAPDRKGVGIGRLLLSWAQRSMPGGFCLWTLDVNLASRAFYERHGCVAGRTRVSPVNEMSIMEYCWTPGPSAPTGGRDA